MRQLIVIVSVLASVVLLTGTGAAQLQTYFVATIDANPEVPPNASPGTGLGCFTLRTDGPFTMLDYEVVYNGLLAPETAAHIHGPAPMGANAGVQFAFGPGNPKIGTFGPLTAAQSTDLLDGLYYVNIHTSMFPGGEIRGQILPSGTPCTLPVEPSTWGAIKALYRD